MCRVLPAACAMRVVRTPVTRTIHRNEHKNVRVIYEQVCVHAQAHMHDDWKCACRPTHSWFAWWHTDHRDTQVLENSLHCGHQDLAVTCTFRVFCSRHKGDLSKLLSIDVQNRCRDRLAPEGSTVGRNWITWGNKHKLLLICCPSPGPVHMYRSSNSLDALTCNTEVQRMWSCSEVHMSQVRSPSSGKYPSRIRSQWWDRKHPVGHAHTHRQTDTDLQICWIYGQQKLFIYHDVSGPFNEI